MSIRHKTDQNHSVEHTDIAFLPLLAAIPTAYNLGTAVYNHTTTGFKWANRARDGYTQIRQAWDFFQGNSAHVATDQDNTRGDNTLNIMEAAWNFFQGTGAPAASSSNARSYSSNMMDAASLSAGGFFMYWVANYAYNTFIKENGQMAKNKLVDMVSHEWNRANSTVQQQRYNKQFQSQLEASAHGMHENGSNIKSKSADSIFNGKNKNLFLIITATVAAFMHSIGAREMQRQTSRDSCKLDQNEPPGIGHWDKIDTSSKNKTISPPIPFVSKQVKKIYANEDYYSKDNSKVGYTSLTHLNIIRTIFNILLGAYIQANKVIGLNVLSEDTDSIVEFSQWATMAMYWEVLAHLLHLHGWGPVYNALQLITKVLYEEASPQQDTSTRGNREHINRNTIKKNKV